MRVCDIKGRVMDAEVMALFAQCMYRPTADALAERMRAYGSDAQVMVLGALEDGRFMGAAAVRMSPDGAHELLAIATHAAHRGRGVGRLLVCHAASQLPPGTLAAETDDDAVGFYARAGFVLTDLGERYPGVRRWRCVRAV